MFTTLGVPRRVGLIGGTTVILMLERMTPWPSKYNCVVETAPNTLDVGDGDFQGNCSVPVNGETTSCPCGVVPIFKPTEGKPEH